MGSENSKAFNNLSVTEKSRCFLRKCSSDKCEECEVCNVLGLLVPRWFEEDVKSIIVVVHCI